MLVFVQLSVFRIWRFAQTARIAVNAMIDASTTSARAHPRRRWRDSVTATSFLSSIQASSNPISRAWPTASERQVTLSLRYTAFACDLMVFAET